MMLPVLFTGWKKIPKIVIQGLLRLLISVNDCFKQYQMEYTAQELFDLLNELDECPWLEAKGGHSGSHSVMETICAFCNEPGLGGGYILFGAAEDFVDELPCYKVNAVKDPDKLQRDLATQCASMFNIPVRADISVEKVNGETVVKAWIKELPDRQKPLYFKSEGLPSGAMRRIGSTDQHCTEDDMHVFYKDSTSYDQVGTGVSIEETDENALKRYRALREKINPAAEELTYSDKELLQSLGCTVKPDYTELNLSGLLLFGSSKAQRSTFPMLRVDYIRVPGNSWVENPDERFTTIDMRGSLILVLYRIIDAINADLPKGFLLEDGLQASASGLPVKALREAIVNALMHRSYREHRPTQVIRYDNRIEIVNPGFSLKSEERLGEPGSETRNPFIAAIFHDTNLAETKGSGIRAMRRLMQQAHLVAPTFESNRKNNEFISRLLLLHFLDENDIEWLKQFEPYELNDSQKQALIFIRAVGAIDNQTYRQMGDCDTLRASLELRALKSHTLIAAKGKGKSTYYVAGLKLSTAPHELSTVPHELSTVPHEISTVPHEISTVPHEISTPPPLLSPEIQREIDLLNKREHDPEKVRTIIRKMCLLKAMKSKEIAIVFRKGEDYMRRKYLRSMIEHKELRYLHPEMINHPEQAYITTNKE